MFRYIYISSPSPGWRREFKYKGDLDKDGLPHGKGEGICNRGHNYNGQWSHGKMHGLGIYYYPSGTFYMGQFENTASMEMVSMSLLEKIKRYKIQVLWIPNLR